MRNAAEALRKGAFIVLFDGKNREGEADLVVAAQFVSPQSIAFLRENAGGLICLATSGAVAESLGLPFYADIVAEKWPALAVRKTAYGDKPAFSYAINSRNVFTGITDIDRSLTITEFASLAREPSRRGFEERFCSPGHVPLLIARDLSERRGHTELSIALAGKAGIAPAVVLCEMLDGETGKALSFAKARAFAEENGLRFIEGKEVV